MLNQMILSREPSPRASMVPVAAFGRAVVLRSDLLKVYAVDVPKEVGFAFEGFGTLVAGALFAVPFGGAWGTWGCR